MTTGGWRAAGILFAVFGAGGLTGAAAMEMLNDPAPETAESREGRRGPPSGATRFGDSDRFVRYIQSRLELSEEQSETIREILNRNSKEATSLYESIRPGLESGVEETRAQIREVLTSEQLEQFDKLLTEERGRRRRNGNRSDGPPRSEARPGAPPTDTPAGPPIPPPAAGEDPARPGDRPAREPHRDHDHRDSGTDEGGLIDGQMGQRLAPIRRT